MVMIVKDHEKKACGFISVTWITVRAHVSALPGRRGTAATVYTCVPREVTAGARMPLCTFRLSWWWRRPAAAATGPMMRNDGGARAPCQHPAAPLAAGWPCLTCFHQVEVPGLAVVTGGSRVGGTSAGANTVGNEPAMDGNGRPASAAAFSRGAQGARGAGG